MTISIYEAAQDLLDARERLGPAVVERHDLWNVLSLLVNDAATPTPPTLSEDLRELEGIVEFIKNYREPWGSWKTAWWEGEVSDDAAFTDDNAMMHIANLANRALARAQVKPS